MTSDDRFAANRLAVHGIAEHLLAAARYQAVGHIGLAVVPGGFATPPFGDHDRVIGLVEGQLVVRDRKGERRAALTTLRAAGEFIGVVPGAPADVYAPLTPCNLDDLIELEPVALSRIVGWYALVDAAIEQFRTEIAADDPSDSTLWPEHFDLAIRAGDVNYGGLAGDGAIDAPYLYVGPSSEVIASGDAFWNQPFGASVTIDEIRSVRDAVTFFRTGRQHAQR